MHNLLESSPLPGLLADVLEELLFSDHVALLGVLAFFRRVGGTLEAELVAVRIGDAGDPRPVAHKWPLGLDPPRDSFAVELESIMAHEADRYTFPELPVRRSGMMSFLPELLQH